MSNENAFSYSLSNPLGPTHWADMYPDAKGLNQSPIDINTHQTRYHPRLSDHSLDIRYGQCNKIKNTGSTFQIYIDHSTNSIATGGPVKCKYKFLQMHMHWCETDRGSEHLVNGKHYAAEIHFVNWNCSKYATPQEAMQSFHPDGLLVFAVFANLGEPNSELCKITRHFKRIHLKDDVDDLEEHIEWANLFPKNLKDYWTYHGSLTTPPCTECVRWVLFRDPIQISNDQLNALRNLSMSKTEEIKMMCNDRPPCDLHHRIVFSSFK